ncbi:MAG TPA: M1 family metallopeptidase, partial [Pyrinomonadaceae bacterium]|nr:M1 family metallopeptidase [Pyrinomonadaceae bacterium]
MLTRSNIVRPVLLSLLAFVAGARVAASQTAAPPPQTSAPFDVKHYDVSLRLDFKERALAGAAEVEFVSGRESLREVEFEIGELEFESVREGGDALTFKAEGGRLSIQLARPAARGEARRLRIVYRGRPTRGVRFFADHVYTVYNTRAWLPCRFHPGDKATINLRLVAPSDMKVVANGRLVAQRGTGVGLTEHAWRQATPIPAYIFGFAAGRFREVTRTSGGVRQRVLFRDKYDDGEARRVFAETHDAARFFAERAGFSLPGAAYTQVLAEGRVEQEMSGFTVIRENYGAQVLKEPRDIWLGVHELSHEWWGNSLTCADWSHFWLNEGIATFMADAYLGERFGRDEYDRQIQLSRESYARGRAAGRDRALAYRHAIEERVAGGPAVYDKGALVLHLLRFEIGERAFWSGLRRYTRANEGRSVTTDNLQRAMERAARRSLSEFFDRWVYGAQAPALAASHRVEGGQVVLTVEQRQKELWPVRLRVAVETSRGRAARVVVSRERRRELRLP